MRRLRVITKENDANRPQITGLFVDSKIVDFRGHVKKRAANFVQFDGLLEGLRKTEV